jgi:low temperature requirement protein LtrA
MTRYDTGEHIRRDVERLEHEIGEAVERDVRRFERWLRPPRIRNQGAARLQERHTTWLEAFFDLVFVLVVATLAGNLIGDHSLNGFLIYAALFLPAWWSWVLVTTYADRFDTDDVVFRLMMFTAMAAAGAMAINLSGNLRFGPDALALAIGSMRVVLLWMWIRVHIHIPQLRRTTHMALASMSTTAALWFGSVAAPEPWGYVMWGVAIALEIAPLALAWDRVTLAPLHPVHLPERFQLFTLIVFGEAVAVTVAGTLDADWHVYAVVAAVLSFVGASCLWWLYYDYLDTSAFKRGRLAAETYVFLHLPLYVGLTAAGAGTALAIADAGEKALDAGARWALCGGSALYLIAVALIQAGTRHRIRERTIPFRLTAAALLILLAFSTGGVRPLAVTGAVTFVLVVLLLIEGLEGVGMGSGAVGGVEIATEHPGAGDADAADEAGPAEAERAEPQGAGRGAAEEAKR